MNFDVVSSEFRQCWVVFVLRLKTFLFNVVLIRFKVSKFYGSHNHRANPGVTKHNRMNKRRKRMWYSIPHSLNLDFSNCWRNNKYFGSQHLFCARRSLFCLCSFVICRFRFFISNTIIITTADMGYMSPTVSRYIVTPIRISVTTQSSWQSWSLLPWSFLASLFWPWENSVIIQSHIGISNYFGGCGCVWSES